MNRVNDFLGSYVHMFLSKSFLEKVLDRECHFGARSDLARQESGPLVSGHSKLTGRLPVITATDPRQEHVRGPEAYRCAFGGDRSRPDLLIQEFFEWNRF